LSIFLYSFGGEERRRIERMMRFFTEFPYKWFRRTLLIPELGLKYNVWGFLLGDYLTL